MNPNDSRAPHDDEIDRLLARQYHDTTPAFEARWVALKRELRSAPAPRRWPSWSVWVGLIGTGAVAALVLTLSTTRRMPVPSASVGVDAPVVAELLAMDQVLGRGRVLLNSEERDALLHLSVPTNPATNLP